MRVISNVIGFDDAPFPRAHRGDVRLVGVVCAGTRMDGLLSARIRRDGANSTETMAAMVRDGRFAGHIRAVLLQGIAVGGFNVVDIHALSRRLDRPVLVVCRREPRMDLVERALRERVPGGERKWRLVQAAGAMEPLRGVWVQRAGLDLAEADALLAATTLHGNLPEALRLAHIIAGGVTVGESRGRP